MPSGVLPTWSIVLVTCLVPGDKGYKGRGGGVITFNSDSIIRHHMVTFPVPRSDSDNLSWSLTWKESTQHPVPRPWNLELP